MILPERGYLAMSGDVFLLPIGRGGAIISNGHRPGMLLNILATQRTNPITKNYLTVNCQEC